jgi:deoxyribodipyrimidine photo-lyase
MPSPPKRTHTAMHCFEPTLEAAYTHLAAVNPDAYANTRNALDGAVTRLSPYITHGFLSLREVYGSVHTRHPLDSKHKFVFELGWRAYWRHVWEHLGDGIHRSIHPGLLPDDAYQPNMPTDVLEAHTGIPAIDLAVRELYETGYLHNHARMWLASYLVHLRKVHWHAAAQWMLGHLLDGDVASNHLSWQWVAGTGSSKPYLFNADNVAKYAPMRWHSCGTVIDTSYEALDQIARSAALVQAWVGSRRVVSGLQQPTLTSTPAGSAWSAPDPSTVVGRNVWLIHPWSLGALPQGLPPDVVVVGVGFTELHSQMPWSERRWRFVEAGLRAHTPQLWWATAEQVAQTLLGAKSVGWQPEPHADAALVSMQTIFAQHGQCVALPRSQMPLFETVASYCPSFSQWWRQTRTA